MGLFQNLIEVNGKATWSEDVPEKLQDLSSWAIHETTKSGKWRSYEGVAMWARWSIEYTNRGINKASDWFAEGIRNGEIADNEYTSNLSNPGREIPEMEKTQMLEDYLAAIETAQQISNELSMNLPPDQCVQAKLIAGRAILLFDMAATQLKLGNMELFIDGLYDACYADRASAYYASWKMGECNAEPNHSILARKGAQARSGRYQPLRDKAIELANAKKFKSRRQAAISIAPEITELSKQLGIGLSEQQAEITITRWLQEQGLPANI